MDSHDSSAAPPPPPSHYPHHQHQHQHQHQPSHPFTILVSQPQPNSYPLQPSPTANNNNIMQQQHHHHQQQQQNPQNQPRFPFNSSMVSSSGPGQKPFSDYSDGGGGQSPTTGGGSGGGGGFSIEPAKKKRGRPRKYSPDGAGSGIALGLSPTTVNPISSTSVVGLTDSSGGGGTLSSETQAKKHRGRPPGSGKKQLDALGAAGVGFTPHVITVKAGEDISSKIMAFSQQGPRTVCILSANGAICNVTLKQPAMSGGTVTYEGRFEIISLSGSFLLSESNGSRSRTGGLSVSLAGSDGRVLGGGVAGMLMAATPVQVVVGSFVADGKKPKGSTAASSSGMLNFGNPVTGASPPSQGATSDSSDDNGSPLNHSSVPYSNAQQIQNIPMYTNMGWPNSTVKMHPN